MHSDKWETFWHQHIYLDCTFIVSTRVSSYNMFDREGRNVLFWILLVSSMVTSQKVKQIINFHLPSVLMELPATVYQFRSIQWGVELMPWKIFTTINTPHDLYCTLLVCPISDMPYIETWLPGYDNIVLYYWVSGSIYWVTNMLFN